MGDQLPTVRGAVVQAAPHFLDREATIDKACDLIREAGSKGADVVVFPEGFVPCHPVWYHFLPATGPQAVELSAELFRNAVVVGSPSTDRLAAAARDAGTWVVMGLCEKRAKTTSTMWNSIVYFSPEGSIAGVHRKIMPTTTERLVHTGGDGEGLRAIDTWFGPLTGLLCGENSNPLLVFSALAQSTVVHAAMWPHFFSRKRVGPTMADVILNNARSLAYQMGSFVLSAGGTLDDTAKSRIAAGYEDLEWLNDAKNLGGSCIVAPNGQVLGGPLGDEEAIIVADMDLNIIIPKKGMHDYAGHYTRPDIFSVQIEPAPRPLFEAPWMSPAGRSTDASPTGAARRDGTVPGSAPAAGGGVGPKRTPPDRGQEDDSEISVEETVGVSQDRRSDAGAAAKLERDVISTPS